MSYSKDEINKAFLLYVKHRGEKVLGRLLISCSPMIDVVLSRYVGEFTPHLEDLHQDVQIKLMKSLRRNCRLVNYIQNPSSYLFFKIRLFASIASTQCRKMFDLGKPLTKLEDEVLQLAEEEKLTVAEIAKRLGLSRRHTNAQYNSAVKKKGAVRVGSAVPGNLRYDQSSVDIIEERTAEIYSLDPLNQLLAKEIVYETLEECLSIIDKHKIYCEDTELRDAVKERIKEVFLQEFGGALS